MRIITYVLAGDELPPAGVEAIARIRCEMLGAKGKLVEQWHPVIIHGEDEAEARAKAQTWWDAEVAKEVAKKATVERLAENRRTTKASA